MNIDFGYVETKRKPFHFVLWIIKDLLGIRIQYSMYKRNYLFKGFEPSISLIILNNQSADEDRITLWENSMKIPYSDESLLSWIKGFVTSNVLNF